MHAPHQVALAHVLAADRSKPGRRNGAAYWLDRLIAPTRRVASRAILPSHEGSQPTANRAERATGLRSRAAVRSRATVRRTAVRNHPGSSAGLNSPGSGDMCRRTGQARRLSWGFVPFSVFGRRCAIRTCRVRTIPLRRSAEARGNTGVSPAPRIVASFRPCGFSPDQPAVTSANWRVHRPLRHLSPAGRPPLGAFAGTIPMCSAGVPVPTTAGSRRLAGLGLSWPAALLGSGPSQRSSGRTVPRHIVHAAKAHVSFARARSSSLFSRGIGRTKPVSIICATAADQDVPGPISGL